MALELRGAPVGRLQIALGLIVLVAGPVQAARLVPALVTESEQRPTSFPRGVVGGVQVLQDGVVTTGEPGEWQLGEYRIAGELVQATILAGFNNGAFWAETYAAAIDADNGDFSFPEVIPEVRNVWFYIAPEAGEPIGQQVTLNLALDWGTTAGIGSATPVGTLTPFTPGELVQPPRLTVSGQRESRTLRVGSYYRLDLTHPTMTRNGRLFSSTRFEASLAPLPAADPPPALVPGDYNRDGRVNAADYTLWRDRRDGPYDFNLDSDGNLDVDAGDRGVWADWYATVRPANTVAAPEPGALALGLLGVLGGKLRRLR